jgi:plastocyanin
MLHPRAGAALLVAALLLASAGVDAANGCLADWSDRRGQNPVVIRSAQFGFDYQPRCARVAAGATLRFESEFDNHPMFGGTVIDDVATIDPNSPIGPWLSGTLREITAPEPVELPYFCDAHFAAPLNMKGSILVVPEFHLDDFEDPPLP